MKSPQTLPSVRTKSTSATDNCQHTESVVLKVAGQILDKLGLKISDIKLFRIDQRLIE